MILLPANSAFEMVLAEMPGVSLPTVRSSVQYACPRLSWLRGEWGKQWFDFKQAYGLTPSLVRGRPVCDIFSRSAGALMSIDLLKTPEAWKDGADTAVALFDLRAFLLAGVDYLGVSTPSGGAHATGLVIVEDDADAKDGKPRLYHYEMQTGFDCPLGASLERGLCPVELRD